MHATLVLALLFVAAATAFAPLKHAKDPIKGHYIVVFNDNVTDVQLARDLSFIAQTHNVVYTHTYKVTIKGFAAPLDPAQLQRVRSHLHVKYVEEDGIATIAQGDCQVEGDADWGLSRICKREIDLDSRYFHPSSGSASVVVYIVDTGIYIGHSDFENRAVWGMKTDPNWGNADGNGHGTHVASIVAGRRFGVVKQATLVAVKVLSDQGSGAWSGVIMGVEWCVSDRSSRGNPPSVANLSLGGGKIQAVNDAVTIASRAGVLMFIASGNSNADTCNFSPASAIDVVAVGSTDIGTSGPNQVDIRSSFSNYGPCTHIFAPGSNILAAWIGNPMATRVLSGTSMATPFVCGVGAIWKQRNPSWSILQVRDALALDATVDVIDLRCPPQGTCSQSPNLMLFNTCE